ncbi:MAG: energy-coupling factor transporter transmembrane protein EcfT [Syntrophomonadaceae bacterium]|jgi:energy-coupling factor transport system permease protein|nr:energy-coupling factor transporter transmembrane protein EcfT [Syntrophomonadaceae bacterium]
MNDIKLGQYVHGNSLIHSLDPRTKIICCTFIVIGILSSHNFWYLLAFLGLILVAIKYSGTPLSSIWRSMRGIRYLLLITFLFQAVLTQGEAVFQVGALSVTREGVVIGLINLLRLVILFLGSILLLMTTTPMKLSAGLEFLLLPLNKIKIPVQYFTTIISIAFRFIPTLVEESLSIKDAQRSRGARFDSPKILSNLKSYLAILIPLLASSMLRAEDLAEAMDSRCYGGNPNQYRMRTLKYDRVDIYLIIFMAIVLLAGLLI